MIGDGDGGGGAAALVVVVVVVVLWRCLFTIQSLSHPGRPPRRQRLRPLPRVWGVRVAFSLVEVEGVSGLPILGRVTVLW